MSLIYLCIFVLVFNTLTMFLESQIWGRIKLWLIFFASQMKSCYGHITTKAAPLIRTGNLNVVELHQYWVE